MDKTERSVRYRIEVFYEKCAKKLKENPENSGQHRIPPKRLAGQVFSRFTFRESSQLQKFLQLLASCVSANQQPTCSDKKITSSLSAIADS
jgi:hypothetical protein